MKKERFFELMNNLDDDMILSSEKPSVKTNIKKASRLKWGALVACYCLVVALSVIIYPHLDILSDLSPHQTGDTDAQNSEAIAEDHYYTNGHVEGFLAMFFPPSNEEAWSVECALVSSIQNGKFSSYQSNRVIDKEMVGEKIASVEVRAAMYYFMSNTEEDVEYLTADIFCIKDVDPEVAVCLKYVDESKHYTTIHYYTWINNDIDPKSTFSLFEAFNATDYLSINSLEICEADHNDSDMLYKLYKLPQAKTDELKSMLLSLNGESVQIDDNVKKNIYQDCNVQLGIYFSLPSAGTTNGLIVISETGYLVTHLGNATRAFNIGENSAIAIIDLIRSGECVSSYNDGVVEQETVANE